MNKKFVVILASAFLGMGMSMPSCPGQQAMQQQVDSLKTSNADLTKQVQAMDKHVKQLETDLTQVKELLQPMGSAIGAQKAAMDQLDSNMKELQTKLTSSSSKSAKAKPASKKKH